MDQELISTITNDKYPRGFANPYRCNYDKHYYIVNKPSDLIGYISQFNEINTYLTVYSFFQYDQDARKSDTARIDTIPFDFDDEETPANSLYDVRKLLGWCERHTIIPRIHYTANKGFHLFIDTVPLYLKEPKYTLKKFFQDMQKNAKFKTADPVVIGDLDRVIRIPNTKHKSTGRYCIPISPIDVKFLEIEDIIEMSYQKSNYVPERNPIGDDHEIIQYIYEIDKQVSYEREQARLRREELKKDPFSNIKVSQGGCPACTYYLEHGATKGERDLAVCGIIQRLKSCSVDKDLIYNQIKDFAAKCTPELNQAIMDSKFRYHMKNDYSPCAFLVDICGECATCNKNKR